METQLQVPLRYTVISKWFTVAVSGMRESSSDLGFHLLEFYEISFRLRVDIQFVTLPLSSQGRASFTTWPKSADGHHLTQLWSYTSKEFLPNAITHWVLHWPFMLRGNRRCVPAQPRTGKGWCKCHVCVKLTHFPRKCWLPMLSLWLMATGLFNKIIGDEFNSIQRGQKISLDLRFK